jgi:tetratricopeptide (TPR) repeat protein/serine/threonine protein kinase
MTAEPDKLRQLFLAALKVPAGQRDAFLREACAGADDLRERVVLLIQAHEELGSIAPPAEAEVRTTAQQRNTESPGTVIGPYKLVELIGEGGMGSVWMAQQAEPVRRLVAVKLIKAGMDSRQVVARFEAERQALALMDHANIARVLDAGTTRGEPGGVSPGRPYFVMDLVKGMPITRYCDEHRLTPRQRLELFIPVCQAVQHAHQKGIIHRDLKPSNVLVALYDGKPVPKVIDFGVAKAAGQSLTDKTLVTGFGNIVGTLEYMSPEQAEVNQLDIDTRSDIYSLGVLLYELLTGSPPFTKKDLEKAGMLEMLRVIREQEPSKPSTKLSTAEGLPTLAANRGTEPAKLTKLVRGELDWIVMKALEKDRSRRYETANGFAMDVQRYLADEPVLAGPPSAWYRFRKLTRRNRGKLAVAALVLFFLVLLGSGAGWVAWDRAARQARAAIDLELALERAELFQEQGKRAEALAAFDRAELLARDAPDPSQDARLAALKERLEAEARDQKFRARFEEIRLEVQSRVDVAASRFTDEAAFPEIREALRHYGIEIGVLPATQAAVLVRARPEPVRRDLIAALDECLRWAPPEPALARQWLLAAVVAADNDPWRVRVRQARAGGNWQALELLARAADVRKQPPSFLLFAASSLPAQMQSTRLELFRRIQGAHTNDLWANHWLGFELRKAGQPAEGIRYLTAALALRPDNPGIYLNRAGALKEAGEVDAGIADLRQCLALAPQYAQAHRGLSNALRDKGRLDEAIAESREAIRLKKDYADAHNSLGNALLLQGKVDEAIAAQRKAIELDPKNAPAHSGLGNGLCDQGKVDEAIAAHRKAIQLDPKLAAAHGGLGNALYAQRKVDEAMAAYRKAIELDPKDAKAHYNLGNALYAKGRLDEAIAGYREAIRLKKDYADAHNSLGNALRVKGRLDEAIAGYREAIRLKKDSAYAHNNLGVALKDKGRLDEAIAEYREAIRLKKDYANAHNNLGSALRAQGKVDEAIAECREAIRLKKDSAYAHNNLGIALCAKGRLDEGIAEFREAIRLKKDYADAHNNLGNALLDKGRLEEAIAAYREAIRHKKDYAEAHCNLGLALKAKGRLDESIAEYQQAIRLNKDLPQAHYGLGNALCNKGRLDEAIAEYREAIALDPKHTRAYRNLGMALSAQRKLDEAIDAYRKAIELDPKFALAHSNLGNALLDQGKLEEAIASFRMAIALDPKLAMAHNYLGKALFQQKKFDEAIACFRKAIELDPKYALAHKWLSAPLFHQGKLDEAIAACRKAIELDPKDAETHKNLGVILQRKGLLNEAVAAYKEAIRINPNYTSAYIASAWLLATASDAKVRNAAEAVKLARKGVALEPKSALSWQVLGWGHYRSGAWKDSIDALHKSIDLQKDGGDSAQWFFLAMAHWQLNHKDEARKWYGKGVEWMKKHGKENEEFRRFQSEAEELLEIKKK